MFKFLLFVYIFNSNFFLTFVFVLFQTPVLALVLCCRKEVIPLLIRKFIRKERIGKYRKGTSRNISHTSHLNELGCSRMYCRIQKERSSAVRTSASHIAREIACLVALSVVIRARASLCLNVARPKGVLGDDDDS